MTDATKQKLSQLYALRAGLSVISQGYDIITDEEETKREAEEDIKNHNTSIEVIEKSREKELLAKRDYWHVPEFNLAYFFGAMFAAIVLTLAGCGIAYCITATRINFFPNLGYFASLACTALSLVGIAIGGYLVLVPIFYILADICQSFSKNISAKIRYRKAAPKINREYDSNNRQLQRKNKSEHKHIRRLCRCFGTAVCTRFKPCGLEKYRPDNILYADGQSGHYERGFATGGQATANRFYHQRGAERDKSYSFGNKQRVCGFGAGDGFLFQRFKQPNVKHARADFERDGTNSKPKR